MIDTSLAEQEAIIERGLGLATFIEVGTALQVIRDQHLYPHRAFEVYVQERWGFTARRARQLMETAEIGNMFPVPNSRVAAELVPVLRARGADAVAAVMAATEAVGPITAVTVRREAQRVLHPIQFAPTAPAPSADFKLVMSKLEEVAQLDATVMRVLSEATPAQHAKLKRLAQRVEKQVTRRLITSILI